MTPRIKDSELTPEMKQFSDILFKQLQNNNQNFDLSGNGPIFSLELPPLIKCQIMFQHDPSSLSYSGQVGEVFFELATSGLNNNHSHDHLTYPSKVFQFLSSPSVEGNFYFGSLGSVCLSKTSPYTVPTQLTLEHFKLQTWLNYALSRELWGPEGKWTRFHQRLHTLFVKSDLLMGEAIPGYYQLKKDAQFIEKFGFNGRMTSDCYELIFPWDFPLTGLQKLEEVITGR